MADLIRIQAIKDELDTDPLGRGYSGMTAVQAADNMNDVDSPNTRTRVKSSVSGAGAFQVTDSTEFDALTEGERAEWLSLCAITDVDPANGTPAVGVATRLFGGGSNTVIALNAFRDEIVSRGQELGFGTVVSGDIENARAL
jgi:hypothetical protein